MHVGRPERVKSSSDIVAKVRQRQVTMLMMDANMALLLVVERLRSRGVHVDVCAWFPWATRDGHRRMDSCCIALSCPGAHQLEFLKGENPQGNWGGVQKLPSRVVGDSQLHDHPGYGQLLHAYLPKTNTFDRFLYETFLKPSLAPCSSHMEDHVRSRGRHLDQRGFTGKNANIYVKDKLHTRERRLDLGRFLFNGKWPNGAHYPLCVMTKMPSTRSAKAKQRRRAKS